MDVQDALESVPTLIDPSDAAALIRSRRTIHTFTEERPPDDLIRRALDLARWAPNHRLTEPWRFYLLGPETAAAVARLNADLVTARRGQAAGERKLKRWRSMPGWLVVTCRRSDDVLREREDYAACCCAVQNLSLYLWSQGVGVKWGTGRVTRHPALFDLLDLDPGAEMIVGLLWYGYPAEIPRMQRKPLDEILHTRP